MADQDSRSGTVLLSALTGAALGAAGLTWWLLSRAERRRALADQVRRLTSPLMPGHLQQTLGDSLEQRVQRLHVAIDDVRRQLEDLSPDGAERG